MTRSELTEFAVEEEGFKLKIRRGEFPVVSAARAPQYALPAETNPPSAPAASSAAPITLVPSPAGDEPGVIYIKSPMVGTFYRSPSPESKSFVENGAKITETTVVCIIEAMKIMNEIQAEVKGTVLETLVENGQPVEYGQRLIKVKQG